MASWHTPIVQGFFSALFWQDGICGIAGFMSIWQISGLSLAKVSKKIPVFRQILRFLGWNLSFWSKFAPNSPLFAGFLSFREKISLSLSFFVLEFLGQRTKKNLTYTDKCKLHLYVMGFDQKKIEDGWKFFIGWKTPLQYMMDDPSKNFARWRRTDARSAPRWYTNIVLQRHRRVYFCRPDSGPTLQHVTRRYGYSWRPRGFCEWRRGAV